MTGRPGGDLAGAPDAQLVEVVDRDGTVERIVTRAEMRRDRLRHRCTYIVVVDHEDRVIVHRRADWKDVWPGRWDLAFGGVAGVGEAWPAAASRELAEEAGVEASLEDLGVGDYEDGDVALVGRVYRAHHDGPFSFPDGEVVDHRRIPLVEVLGWIEARPHTPDSVALFRRLIAPG